MKRLCTFLLLVLSLWAKAEVSPYVTDARVKEDLDNVLSRIMDREQFLVQVTAQFSNRARRKLVEGETIEDAPSVVEPPKAPDPMPGFVPDSNVAAPETRPAKKTRETYQNVEEVELSALQVTVSFDEELSDAILSSAKRLVSEYLFVRFGQKTQLSFYRLPMLKPKMREVASTQPQPEKTPSTMEELIWKWLPWGLFLVMLVALLWKTKAPKARIVRRKDTPVVQPLYPFASYPGAQAGNAATASAGPPQSDEERVKAQRKNLLATVLANATAFRLYYENLNPDEQGEIEATLAGPAFENLMTSLVKKRSAAAPNVDDAEKCIQKHSSQFEEYIRSKQWQEQQLFGFLQGLGNEQVMSLVNFESDLNVCLILRFLKAEQSAFVLDNLAPERRLQVLQKMNEIYSLPLSEIAKSEHQIRSIVQRLPSTPMGPGKQEVDFWGNVLSQSTHTPEILEELEQTQSKIVGQLQKFKLTLEDAASLPDEFLTQILSETDNEELCLALTTCSEQVIGVILDNVSERRREVLLDQLPSYKNANKDAASRARNNLTRKIREAAA